MRFKRKFRQKYWSNSLPYERAPMRKRRFFGGRGRGRSGASPARVRKSMLFGMIAMIFIIMVAPKVRQAIFSAFSRWFPTWVA